MKKKKNFSKSWPKRLTSNGVFSKRERENPFPAAKEEDALKTLSKKKQKKSGNKKDQPASTINLITAIVNLVIAILLLIEKLTR